MDAAPTIEGVRELVQALNLQDTTEALRVSLDSRNSEERVMKG
jgi:hypothetical protein